MVSGYHLQVKKNIKRYVNLVSISHYALLVVKHDEPFAGSHECIVIPICR